MLNAKIVKLINEQINKEFFSAYFYLDIANYYISKNLNGFGNWFNVQAQEERSHAMLFVKYLQNNGEDVELDDIKALKRKFADFSEPLNATLEHEIFVTESINNIYAAALENKDFRTTQFLDWFIKEQGEEEQNADDLIKKYDLFGKDGKGLYLLDSELAARVYAPPSLVI
ncbi:ferritin [Cellulosilyticum sp. I15G10I2]|uniref:ferritin n=1 Tax=Cellulosilyticum sp. I15G10I2 TaxID=1892843 RepID=UPI00085BB340|nr:ferritin [Cellulosilyticum sp. I15G10I2]